MPFAEGQSVSPRVTPELLHPASVDAGDIFFKCSDDDGLTWSERHRVGVPRSAMDRDEPGDIHGWNFRQPWLLPTGQVLVTYAKMKRSGLYPKGWRLASDNQWQTEPGTDPATKPMNEQGGSPNDWSTEVFFVELANILTESDPLWIAVGREAPGVTENAGLYFTKPKVIVYNDGVPGGPFKDFEIGYPQFYHFGGRNYVAYSNKTCQNRINEVPDALLEDAGLPGQHRL